MIDFLKTPDFLVLASVVAITVNLLVSFQSWAATNRYVNHLRSKKDKYRTAVHESGHVMAIALATNERVTLRKVSTVAEAEMNGYVDYRITQEDSLPWEDVVISLGGIAGEHVAIEAVHPPGAEVDLKHAVERAQDIVKHGRVQIRDLTPVRNLGELCPSVEPAVVDVMNFCFNIAVERIKSNETGFFRIVDSLIDRRELTGKQVTRLLEVDHV